MKINYNTRDVFENDSKTFTSYKKPIKTKQNLIKDDRILNKIWLKVSTHIQRLGTTHAPNPPV